MGRVSEGEGSCNDGGSGRGDEGRSRHGHAGDSKVGGGSNRDSTSRKRGRSAIVIAITGTCGAAISVITTVSGTRSGTSSQNDVSRDSPAEGLHAALESEVVTAGLVSSGGGGNPTPKVSPHSSGLV
jgi:hypothetical protein